MLADTLVILIRSAENALSTSVGMLIFAERDDEIKVLLSDMTPAELAEVVKHLAQAREHMLATKESLKTARRAVGGLT
jgi:hypothetical protein